MIIGQIRKEYFIMHDSWMTWGLGGMWFVHLVWIALVTAFVWILFERLREDGPTGRGRSPDDSARRILDERYARGEIDQAEYEARRRVLAH
jgi:putative membrane protein